jgi:hypothetical protein
VFRAGGRERLPDRERRDQPATAAAEGRAGWWYLFYFATERGRLGYRRHTYDLTKLIWQLASPTWDFDGATFDCTAASFANPDHVDIVIHNYRWRLGLADGEERYLGFEQRLAERLTIAVPTITIVSRSAARTRTARPTPTGSQARRGGPAGCRGNTGLAIRPSRRRVATYPVDRTRPQIRGRGHRGGGLLCGGGGSVPCVSRWS